MIYWLVGLGLFLLISSAIIFKVNWLRIVVMVVLLAGLIGREFSFGAYARSESWRKAQEQTWSEQYRDGMTTMLDYCDITGLYVIGTYILIAILFIRVMRQSSKNSKE